jgi:hypothetical protein
MNDLIFVSILLACLAVTFGLLRACSVLMPRDSHAEGEP